MAFFRRKQTNVSRDLDERLNVMRDDGFAAMKDWHDIWQDGLNYIFNNQLAGKKVKDGWEAVVTNYIFPATMQELAIQSQRNATILAQPQEPDDKDAADVWQRHFQFLYDQTLDIPNKMLRATLDGKVYGHYIFYTYWEPQLRWDSAKNAWEGGVQVQLVRPEYVAFDPEAESANDGHIISRRKVNREWALHRWPDYTEEISNTPPDDILHKGNTALSTLAYKNAVDTGELGSRGRLVNALLNGRNKALHVGGSGKQQSRYVTLEQFWFHDYEESTKRPSEPIPEEELLGTGKAYVGDDDDLGVIYDTETKQPLTPANWPTRATGEHKEPRYPNGRFVIRIGDTVLNPDESQQVWPYERWPFTVGVNHILPHTWAGLNGVEMAKDPQDRVNSIATHLTTAIKMFGDPIVIVEEGARKQGTRFRSGPGSVWQVNKGKSNAVSREPGVGPSPAVFEMYKKFADDLKNQTGVQDVGLGRKTPGKTTAHEIQTLESNTKLRMALSEKLMDAFTVEHWKIVAEICQKHYTPEQIIRVVGEKDASTVETITSGMKDAMFDIKLEVGTSLPFDRDRRKMEAMELFTQFGPAMAKNLLDAYEVKNSEEVLAQYEIYQQFLQYLEQVEEQQKAQGAEGQAPEGQANAEAG